MSKKVKILVSVLVAVLLLTVGGTAAVMAQDGSDQDEPTQEEPEGGRKGRFLAKVAELLDMTEEELIEIFKQARQELREEAFINYVNKAAERGIISPEEAEEIIDWWENRPEAVDKLFPYSHILQARRGRHLMAAPDKPIRWGCITDSVTNQIRMQWQNRTEVQERPVLRARILQAIRSRHQFAVPEGWHRLGPPEPAN